MVIVVYVRHGKKDTSNFNDGSKGTIDSFLTAEGILQSAATGNQLGKIKGIGRIISSPLPRTIQTARIFQEEYLKATGRSLPIQTDSLLLERQFREFNNKTPPNGMSWVEFRSQQAQIGYPLIENFEDIKGRVKKFVDKLMSADPNQIVIAVSHQDTIHAAIANALQTDELDAIFDTGIKVASITIISYMGIKEDGTYVTKMITCGALELSEDDLEELKLQKLR